MQRKEVEGGAKANSSADKMPQEVEAKMNAVFKEDFSDVKIHQNSAQAQEIGAQAFTQGKDIHFAQGQYKPESKSGQDLLGHELTHVVQQSQGRVKPTTQMKNLNINDDTALEKEADLMGAKAAQATNTPTDSDNTTEAGNANVSSVPVIQGKFNHTKKSVEAEGLTKGIKLIGKSSSEKILQALDAYTKVGDDREKQRVALNIIIQQCGAWFTSNTRKKNKKSTQKSMDDFYKHTTINKIKNDAETEIRELERLDDLEDQEYVKKIENGTFKSGGKNHLDFAKDRLGKNVDENLTSANEFAEDFNFNDAGSKKILEHKGAKLTQDHKLKAGELSALRRFTGQEYKYMNPAFADNDAWLESGMQELGLLTENKADLEGDERKKQVETYKSEGKEHSKMALKALDKLPPYKGKVYRGLGVTQDEFDKNYKKGKSYVFPALTSTSWDITKARAFAFMSSKPVKVILEIDSKTGKNISSISASAGEKEVAFRSGTTFEIIKVKAEQYIQKVYLKEK